MTSAIQTIGRTVSDLLRRLLFVAAALLLLLSAGLGYFSWRAAQRETLTPAQAAPQPGQFVRAGDAELFVQQTGPPFGPRVMLIPGAGAWSETWRETMKALAQAGFWSIAVDLPPFGFSEKPVRPRYQAEDQAARIVAAVGALNLSRVALVCHSSGCPATVDAALLLKERVTALVLVDAALGLETGETAARRKALSPWADKGLRVVFQIKPIRNAVVAATIANPLLTKLWLRPLVASPAATDALAAVLQQPLVVKGSTDTLADWLGEFLFGADTTARSRRPESYAALKAPTLLLWGEQDTITPVSQGYRLGTLLPSSTLIVLSRVGHLPFIDDPGQFNRALVGFLATQRLRP